MNSVFKNENSHKITLFLPPAANIHPKICTRLKKNHCSFFFTLARALLHTILPPAPTGCDSISEKPTPFPHPPQYAISDGELPPRFAASPPGKKTASPKKNCGYYKQGSIVFVDQWVNCYFGCFPQPLHGGGMSIAVCGNYSAMQ